MACEMDDTELQALVAADQQRRTIERALGRTKKVLEEQDDEGFKLPKKPGRPRTKSRVKDNKPPPQTLEGFGLATEICQKLRATGKPDWQLILELQGAGLI
jgi:hypothetical protein